jgi:hypothetical protein
VVVPGSLEPMVEVRFLSSQPLYISSKLLYNHYYMSNNTIEHLLKEGKTYKEISRITGKAKSTISYRAKKLNKGISVNPKFSIRYDWSKVKDYAKTHTRMECMNEFGFSTDAWSKAAREGKVDRKPNSITLEKVAIKNSKYTRSTLRRRLIKHKIIPYKCNKCGNEGSWNNLPLSLQLNHKNGVDNDHRLKNIEFLCPNCHSQTPTFAGRNKQYKSD